MLPSATDAGAAPSLMPRRAARPSISSSPGTKDAYASGATRDAAAGKGRYDLISTHALRRLAVV